MTGRLPVAIAAAALVGCTLAGPSWASAEAVRSSESAGPAVAPESSGLTESGESAHEAVLQADGSEKEYRTVAADMEERDLGDIEDDLDMPGGTLLVTFIVAGLIVVAFLAGVGKAIWDGVRHSRERLR